MSEPEKATTVVEEQSLDKRAAREAYLREIPTMPRGEGLSSQDFEPNSLDGLLRVAELIARNPIAPKVYQGAPEIALMVLWKGRERGLTVMRSLELIYPFQSSKGPQVAYAADLLYGMVERSGACEYFLLVESSASQAVYETQRKGHPQPVRLPYTLDQAKMAGLLGKDNWKSDPASMLRARAKSNLCRAVYGDVIAGLYTKDELEAEGAINVTPGESREARTEKVMERVRGRRVTVADQEAALRTAGEGLMAPVRETAVRLLTDPEPRPARGFGPLVTPLSEEQVAHVYAYAERKRYRGDGWLALKAAAPQIWGNRIEMLPSAAFDDILMEIDEHAGPEPEGEETDGTPQEE